MAYKLVNTARSEDVARLAVCLTNEIIERAGVRHFNVDVWLAIILCDSHYHVVAAFDKNAIVGFGVLCERWPLYAEAWKVEKLEALRVMYAATSGV